jgi:hypothetical protein
MNAHHYSSDRYIISPLPLGRFSRGNQFRAGTTTAQPCVSWQIGSNICVVKYCTPLADRSLKAALPMREIYINNRSFRESNY